MRFRRPRSRSTQPSEDGKREPYPQFFPLLMGWTGVWKRLAMRRHSSSCPQFAGRRIAGTDRSLGNVAVSALLSSVRSLITCSAPNRAVHSWSADANLEDAKLLL